MKVLDEFIEEIKKFGVVRLAKKAGLNQPTISSWCCKKTTPSLVNAQKAANAMGLEFLLFEMEETDEKI